MIDVAELRDLPLFEEVPLERIADLLAVGTELEFAAGDELFVQGTRADRWWVLLQGRVDLVRLAGHEQMRVGEMSQPGQWAGGFTAWNDDGVYLATGRAVTTGRALRVAADDLRSWTARLAPFAAHLIEGVFRTARTVESLGREREALVALGTLSAGLAHELNNPAASATRAVTALEQANGSLLGSLGALASANLTADQFTALDQLRGQIAESRPVWSSIELADREEQLGSWLEDHGVDGAWGLAATFAGAGVDVGWCVRAEGVLGPALTPGLTWVASVIDVTDLVSEVKESTTRVSELVAAVKSYSQMDRASVQETDVVEGLESTLTVLSHRVPAEVDVVKHYAPDTPTIQAIPAELNQVWTNLIVNALDAMGDAGTLRLSTRPEGDGVIVEVANSGTWTDQVSRAKAFDPFFTTKDVGQGTGLGLDISRRIVVGRHGGEISIDDALGETVLRVWLPLRGGPTP